MGSGFAKFAEEEGHGQGGDIAGGSPDDWNQEGRGQERPGQSPGTAGEQPSKPKPPPVPQFTKPFMYSPRQSELQSASYNINSTSHQYLARFGVAGKF